MLPLQGAWVRAPMGELIRCDTPPGADKKKKERKKEKKKVRDPGNSKRRRFCIALKK